jgi:hypothetical protein
MKVMGTPKIVLTADRTLMSPYRGLSLATFFGCAPALDPHRKKTAFGTRFLETKLLQKFYLILFVTIFLTQMVLQIMHHMD